MTGYKRTFGWITLVLAVVIVVGVFVQAYSITAFVADRTNDTAFDLHSNVGGALHGIEVLTFITALVAYWGLWREVAFTFLLPLIGTIQLAFAPEKGKTGDGWVHGFHGLLALVVLVLAAIVAHRAMRALGLRGGAAAV